MFGATRRKRLIAEKSSAERTLKPNNPPTLHGFNQLQPVAWNEAKAFYSLGVRHYISGKTPEKHTQSSHTVLDLLDLLFVFKCTIIEWDDLVYSEETGLRGLMADDGCDSYQQEESAVLLTFCCLPLSVRALLLCKVNCPSLVN